MIALAAAKALRLTQFECMASSSREPNSVSLPSSQYIIPHLHHLDNSQAHRIHWLLQELRLLNPSFAFRVTHYKRGTKPNPALVAVHSLGRSPVLTLKTADGSPPPIIQLEPGVLTESRLIAEYLSSEFGDGMFHADCEEDELRDKFFSEYGVATLQMLTNINTFLDFLPELPPPPISWVLRVLVAPLVRHWLSVIGPTLQIMEDGLSDEKPWFSGTKLGLADFSVSFAMDTTMQRGWFDKVGGTERFPKLAAWYERVRTREAYQLAMAESKAGGGGNYDLVTFGWGKWFGGWLG